MQDEPASPLWQRLAWFAGLWVGGVIVVAIMAYGLRLWLL